MTDHYSTWKDNYAVYNPHDKPVEELPIILGFNNGGSDDWWSGELVAEDGTGLGGHICSNEGFMYGDLGILVNTRADRHEGFRKHYPDGYRMDFMTLREVYSPEGRERLDVLIKKNKALAELARGTT